MHGAERKVSLITSLGKKYTGMIDVPNEGFRTTDLFNSSNVYWKNPNLKCYDDALLVRDVSVYLDGKSVFRRFDSVQVKVPEIIFLYDDIAQLHDEMEKKRADAVMSQSRENAQKIHILTSRVANSFFEISGHFSGMFLKKSRDRFVPITQATVTEVYKSQGKWFQKKLELPHGFICLSNRHIEAVKMG